MNHMSRHVLKLSQLPAGFAESLHAPPATPHVPLPAATVVLLRSGPRGLETLLLQRSRTSGFIPGAWVFPGGRVDDDDARLGQALTNQGVEPEPEPEPEPKHAPEPNHTPDEDSPFRIAALREAFEETGVLLIEGSAPVSAADQESADLARWREHLLGGRASFEAILDGLGVRPGLGSLGCFARWITPVIEPRRFDARFYLAEVPSSLPVSVHEAELVDAVWESPAQALDRHDAGDLPMVFPTIHTLEQLADFDTPRDAIEAMTRPRVPAWLPRLVADGDFVTMQLDELAEP